MHENNQERKWTRIRSKGIELRVLNIESSWKKKTDTAADDHTDEEEEEEEVLDRVLVGCFDEKKVVMKAGKVANWIQS